MCAVRADRPTPGQRRQQQVQRLGKPVGVPGQPGAEDLQVDPRPAAGDPEVQPPAGQRGEYESVFITESVGWCQYAVSPPSAGRLGGYDGGMVQAARGVPRNTRQRAEVLALLRETGEFRSAQQLHAQLRSQGSGIGLTTVYRTLQLLAEAGEVDQFSMTDGEQLYRRCELERHHHHLVCRGCGRTVEVEGPAVERWADKVGQEHGFSDVSHTMEILGTCSECARGSAARTARNSR
jgi:Fur family transcriptional regulator, ferric uptake regulator